MIPSNENPMASTITTTTYFYYADCVPSDFIDSINEINIGRTRNIIKKMYEFDKEASAFFTFLLKFERSSRIKPKLPTISYGYYGGKMITAQICAVGS